MNLESEEFHRYGRTWKDEPRRKRSPRCFTVLPSKMVKRELNWKLEQGYVVVVK
jgi:hypothetical protein